MNSLLIHKDALARNFSAAAGTYDAWAQAQAQIACRLLDRLPRRLLPSRAVDLGCGTGIVARLLLERFAALRLIGVDLAEAMIDQCQRRLGPETNCAFVCGDAETPSTFRQVMNALGPACVLGRLANPPNQVDLITCASSCQWFSDPQQTLRMWCRGLAPGGVLAVASMVEGSCPELQEAEAATGAGTVPAFRFLPPGLVGSAALEAGLGLLLQDAQPLTCWHPHPRAALRSFHGLGATLVGQPGHVSRTPGQMRRLLTAYRRHARPDGSVPVTYQVEYLIARASP